MKVVLIPLFLAILLCTPFAYAQEFNAGIVQGLWYSQEKVFAGETVRMYIAIRNNTGSELTGTVEFFDNDERLSRKNVQALDGRIIESWADWTPTYGEHTLRANLSRIELHKVGTSTKEVEVISALAEDTLTIDYDTDKDDIGNTEDSDDDGDGVSDTEEKQNGTDPLVKDAPQEQTENASASNDSNEDTQGQNDTDSNASSNTSEGLERFLTPGPAQSALSSVSDYIEEARINLDEYRASRNARNESPQLETSSSTVTVDGFGEVVRSASTTEEDTVWTHDFSLWDFIKSVWALALTLFGTIYTFVLAALSFVLKHAMLVQVGVLLLILFLLVKLAAKFGRRPKHPKF